MGVSHYDHRKSLKAMLRHCLFKIGLDDVRTYAHQKLRGRKFDHLKEEGGLSRVFGQIYKSGVWVEDARQDSLSGLGSSSSSTEGLQNSLSLFLRDIDCRTLIDVGCGDFNWMKNVEGTWNYIGIDIVEEVIANNAKLYTTAKRKFVCADATQTPLPHGDIVICREVIFHLSLKSGLNLLTNVAQSATKYLIVTSDPVWFNSDCKDGDHRPLNLRKRPFSLPRPFKEIVDERVMKGRRLLVWYQHPGRTIVH